MSRWMTVALLCVALPSLADRRRGDPLPDNRPRNAIAPEDEKAVHDYKLTTSNTEKLVDANKRIRELLEKDKALEKEEAMREGRTFDDKVKRIEAHPQAVSAMKSAGLSPKEFLVGTVALMNAVAFSQMKKSDPRFPLPDYVNPDNLRFIDDHPQLLEKIQNAFGIGEHKQRPHRGADEGGSDSGDKQGKNKQGDE